MTKPEIRAALIAKYPGAIVGVSNRYKSNLLRQTHAVVFAADTGAPILNVEASAATFDESDHRLAQMLGLV